MRVLHPASFLDDPTRLLRLARYGDRLGVRVEPETEGLARVAIDAGALRAVSGPRIGAELRLLAGEDDPVAGLVALTRWGMSRAIHPALGLDEPELARSALALLPAEGGRTGSPWPSPRARSPAASSRRCSTASASPAPTAT